MNFILKRIGFSYRIRKYAVFMGKSYGPYERHYADGNDCYITWEYKMPEGQDLYEDSTWEKVHSVLSEYE